jgi:MOB kinase activator 1
LTIVVDFYNQINLLYGSITEFCSPQSCPEMKATDEYGPSMRAILLALDPG